MPNSNTWPDSEHPVLRSHAEIETFLLRAEPFIETPPSRATLFVGPSLARIGSFESLVEQAGPFGAVQEILAEAEREAAVSGPSQAPHLVVFPSGWVALLRHPGDNDPEDTPLLRIAVCPFVPDPDVSKRVEQSLAQVLLGLRDLEGHGAPTAVPLAHRDEDRWDELLTRLVDRDRLEETFAALLKKRGAEKAERARRTRSSVIDGHLRWLAARMPAPVPARASRPRGPARPASARDALVDLRDHVINMRFGELSDGGQFQTSPSDVAAIADRAKAWIDAAEGRRLAIYAHGGLVSEAAALAHVRITARWWLDNGVFPIFCVWESDAVTTILKLIRETLGIDRTRAFGLDELRDAAVERLTRTIGPQIWDTMKRSARLASADGDRHGLTLLVAELRRAFGGTVPGPHLVGHSAGAILLLHLMARLRSTGIVPGSFQTLAPAATTALYRDGLAAFSGTGLPCRIYTMTDANERNDDVIGLYGKSLLYLVSRGFESVFGETISGLQKDLLADPVLVGRLTEWANGVTREALVFSKTPDGTPRRLCSNALTHGGFDNDRATMWSVMHFIRGPQEAALITPFPEEAAAERSRQAAADDALPEEVRTYLALVRASAAPVPATTPVAAAVTAPALPRTPTRRALTIGINEYAAAKRLDGCVNDSNLWRDMLAARGYSVLQRTRPEKTGREQILRDLRDFVASAAAGDMLVWHFSGHGLEIEPEHGSNPDFEITGFDQAIVASNTAAPTDAQIAHAIIDDEIHSILGALDPQAFLHVFLDSCFSGTATRLMLSGRVRTMGTVRRRGYVPRRRSLTAPHAGTRGPYDGANHVLYSAASATQPAIENGAPVHGVFTRAVSELLRTHTGTLTNAEFRARVNELMPGNDQTSGLHCDPSRVDEPFPLLPGY